MINTVAQVIEFHEKFNLPTRTVPTIPDYEEYQLRIDLLQEELDELKEALDNNDIVEVLDALTDIRYLLDGAYIQFGLVPVMHKASTEVHNSNMSKLGEDGKPVYREDGKIMKGPNYFRPNLKQFIKE